MVAIYAIVALSQCNEKPPLPQLKETDGASPNIGSSEKPVPTIDEKVLLPENCTEPPNSQEPDIEIDFTISTAAFSLSPEPGKSRTRM